MPKLAVFPKAYMNALCVDGSMSVHDWLLIAESLEVDGVEWYAGFIENEERTNWSKFKSIAHDKGLEIPMLCCSPDFTHPDRAFRQKQIDKEKKWIDMAAELGAGFCRVLSGQRRPNVSIAEGLKYAADSIECCLTHAEECGVSLVIENHYKDDFWEYPEFAQHMEVFCGLVEMIEHPRFGVNYDPSNTYLAGEDPIELLRRVSSRVMTMHASDRYLIEGTLDDLRREESGSSGYARRLRHGQIGEGLNDYDSIFEELKRVDFTGWISIEDGVDGIDQLRRSVDFLKKKMSDHFAR
ncbi:MAG: sugar phosphate isomerase/epimerase family protein [Verrucomicrobiota bacterium]|nr:sugar phosphate isomerase/epimerase family protein [Verrucomicrobiota bacterium]MEE2967820.1 sugar phosphate isomerase/epimerase family protein [Verrucomicrobiota bacterium]